MFCQLTSTFGLLTIVVLVYGQQQPQAQPAPGEPDASMSKNPQCRGVDIKYSEDKMMNMIDCVNATGAETARDIPAEKIPCFIKCVLNTQGLIDENGMPHKENIMKAVDTSMPDDVKEDLKAGFSKCLDDYGKSIDPKDQTCMAFAPLSECFHMCYMKLCKLP